MLGDPLQVAGADHCQNGAPGVLRRGLAQLGRHVAIAFGDQWLVKVVTVVRELREGGLQDIALLEVFDILFADLLA